VRQGKTGVIDYYFDQYLKLGQPRGQSLIEWTARDYDPDKLKADFRSQGWGDFLVDTILRRE
jgi:hypothetical protein